MFKCKAICLGLRQGAGKPSINHRESMEEDDMVIRVGSSLRKERDEPIRRARRAVGPRSL